MAWRELIVSVQVITVSNAHFMYDVLYLNVNEELGNLNQHCPSHPGTLTVDKKKVGLVRWAPYTFTHTSCRICHH